MKDRDKLILKFLHPNGTPTEEAFKDFTKGKVKGQGMTYSTRTLLMVRSRSRYDVPRTETNLY